MSFQNYAFKPSTGAVAIIKGASFRPIAGKWPTGAMSPSIPIAYDTPSNYILAIPSDTGRRPTKLAQPFQPKPFAPKDAHKPRGRLPQPEIRSLLRSRTKGPDAARPIRDDMTVSPKSTKVATVDRVGTPKRVGLRDVTNTVNTPVRPPWRGSSAAAPAPRIRKTGASLNKENVPVAPLVIKKKSGLPIVPRTSVNVSHHVAPKSMSKVSSTVRPLTPPPLAVAKPAVVSSESQETPRPRKVFSPTESSGSAHSSTDDSDEDTVSRARLQAFRFPRPAPQPPVVRRNIIIYEEDDSEAESDCTHESSTNDVFSPRVSVEEAYNDGNTDATSSLQNHKPSIELRSVFEDHSDDEEWGIVAVSTPPRSLRRRLFARPSDDGASEGAVTNARKETTIAGPKYDDSGAATPPVPTSGFRSFFRRAWDVTKAAIGRITVRLKALL